MRKCWEFMCLSVALGSPCLVVAEDSRLATPAIPDALGIYYAPPEGAVRLARCGLLDGQDSAGKIVVPAGVPRFLVVFKPEGPFEPKIDTLDLMVGSSHEQVEIVVRPRSPGLYEVEPAAPLAPGWYRFSTQHANRKNAKQSIVAMDCFTVGASSRGGGEPEKAGAEEPAPAGAAKPDPQPAAGQLLVTSTPPGLKVHLLFHTEAPKAGHQHALVADGDVKGETPLLLDLKPGHYSIGVERTYVADAPEMSRVPRGCKSTFSVSGSALSWDCVKCNVYPTKDTSFRDELDPFARDGNVGICFNAPEKPKDIGYVRIYGVEKQDGKPAALAVTLAKP